MVNLNNMLELEPEPNWEKTDWLPKIPENQEDEAAMNEWRSRTNISILLYNLELLERKEYFKKNGSSSSLLEKQFDHQVFIKKGKRSPRKKRCAFANFILVVCNSRKRRYGWPGSYLYSDQEPEKKKKMIVKTNFNTILLPCIVHCLPIEFKNCIQELGGSSEDNNILLVIQKPLFKTDVSKNHNRLSIPFSQVKNVFLTEEEMNHLDMKNDHSNMPEIEVILIDPCLVKCNISLRKWDMGNSKTYVLVRNWYDVVSRNRLFDGMVVQLWSFRVGSQLGFALVKV